MRDLESRARKDYERAREVFAELGVDTDHALEALEGVSLSLPCWQADDVGGFEGREGGPGGGLQVTGSRPGRPRSPEELRADLSKALSLVPGRHRVNLHAMYGEFGKGADRDRIGPEHFRGWVDWARSVGAGLDFNATCFAHPKAEAGFTLASPDEGIRSFWVEHVRRAREVGAWMGRELGETCLHNLWIPDGTKDLTTFRFRSRERLFESLDRIYAERFDPGELKDSVESKLFGIGTEAFTAGSHEFYLLYAMERGIFPCLDTGHFHPTESVADKISSLLLFFPELLLHLSRGIRWDSDHVVILEDALEETACEAVRAGALDRIHWALDFFDAGLNRVGALVLGARAVQKALLLALLEPVEKMREREEEGDRFGLLALRESWKELPSGAVWRYFCREKGVPFGADLVEEVAAYEREVLLKREG